MLAMTDKPNHPGAAPEKFSETDARQELATFKAMAGMRPSVRTLAERWGWKKSTAARFVAEFDSDQTPEQVAALLAAGGADFDKHFPPKTAEQSVARVAADLADKPVDDDRPDDADRIALNQPETWVYANNAGGITIRQDGTSHCDDDQFVYLTVDAAQALALRLQHIIEEIEQGRE